MMIGVVRDLYHRTIMKIFFMYILFLFVGVLGFVATISLGLPKTTSHDGLVALSGMCVGAICSLLMILFLNRNSNERV